MGRYVLGEMERCDVGGKTVYIAESHHMVLEAWAELRRNRPAPPHVVTLDYHTDLRKAFTGDCLRTFDESESQDFPDAEEAYAHMGPLVSRLATLDPAEVKAMIDRLTFEEHIDAAQRACIIDHVFLCLSSRPGIPPDSRQHAVWKETYARPEADTVLEPGFLGKLVGEVEKTVGQPLEALPYILDIDLDFFRTAKAIQPEDPSVFHRLIRHAQIITVALEPNCVKDCRLPREKITSERLLDELTKQIEVAARQPDTPL